jgi:hypothetical protein
VETVDLSHLSGSLAREFKKELTLGKETSRLAVVLLPQFNESRVSVTYYDGAKRRGFWRTYKLKAVPASLTRGLVRLGASDAYMRELQEAYEEILAQASGVRHEDVHTDTGAEY